MDCTLYVREAFYIFCFVCIIQKDCYMFLRGLSTNCYTLLDILHISYSFLNSLSFWHLRGLYSQFTFLTDHAKDLIYNNNLLDLTRPLLSVKYGHYSPMKCKQVQPNLTRFKRHKISKLSLNVNFLLYISKQSFKGLLTFFCYTNFWELKKSWKLLVILSTHQ